MKYIPKYQSGSEGKGNRVTELPMAQDGTLIEKIKGSKLNPKNWGVSDYTDKGDFNTAYSSAKKAGEEEFLWKNKRYSTKYAGTPRQEAGRYGVKGKPVHSMDLNNPIQVNRYDEIVSEYLPGHIEAGILNPINRNILENSVNKSSSGENKKRTLSINHKGIGEKLYVYGADDYNSDKVTSGYNLLFNNCADATCDSFGLNKEGITTPRQTISKIKDKYQTIDVTGRTYSDYFAQWRDSKNNILENVDYWLGINSSPDINSTQLGKNIVRSIQKNLVKEGYSLPKSKRENGEYDGVYGEETKNALLEWKTKAKKKLPKAQNGWLSKFPPVYKSRQEADAALNPTGYTQTKRAVYTKPTDKTKYQEYLIGKKFTDQTTQKRNIHTNQPVISPYEAYAKQKREEQNVSEIAEILKANQEYAKAHSDIYIDPQTGKQVIQNIGIKPTASPIDAAVLGVAALASGGMGLLGSMTELANPIGFNPFKQAYKLNPWAFKPNPEMMYRGIGKSGYKDAIESGVLRARPSSQLPPRDLSMHPLIKQKVFDKVYYTPAEKMHLLSKQYGNGYIAEVPKVGNNFRFRYGKDKPWSQLTEREIPISEAKLYKEHWLQGYKEIPKKENGGG